MLKYSLMCLLTTNFTFLTKIMSATMKVHAYIFIPTALYILAVEYFSFFFLYIRNKVGYG